MATSTPRKIIVDGQPYRWRVAFIDRQWVRVRLWRDGDRQAWSDVKMRFSDPWLSLPGVGEAEPAGASAEAASTPPVTPRRVADVIRYLNEYRLGGSVEWEDRDPQDT